MTSRWLVGGLAAGVLVLTMRAEAKLHATTLFALGDSLSDAGNLYLYLDSQGLSSLFPPVPPYDKRYSNGPVFVEQLGSLVGTPTPLPSLMGGTDFAWGGARATTTGGPAGKPVPTIEQQVGQLLLSGYVPAPTDLFILFGGANDLFDEQPNPAVPAQAMANQVKTLADAGAKQIVLMNLPPVQYTPYGLSETPQMQAGIAAWVGGFNALLAADVQTIRPTLAADVALYEFDTAAFFNAMIADPQQYGFTNVTEQALGGGTPVLNPDQYLFWDSVHPTTAGHAALASAVAALPEPASMSVLAGIVGVLLVRRRAA